MRPTLDQYLMGHAMVAAKRATCIKRAVGCVLADVRGRVLSVGYNGVASGRLHCNEPTGFNFVYANGINKRKPLTGQSTGQVSVYGHACVGHDLPSGQDSCEAVHAEQNALIQCRDVDRIHTAYVTLSPCKPCMKLLLNTPCLRVVFLEEHTDPWPGEQWQKAGRAWDLLPGFTD